MTSQGHNYIRKKSTECSPSPKISPVGHWKILCWSLGYPFSSIPGEDAVMKLTQLYFKIDLNTDRCHCAEEWWFSKRNSVRIPNNVVQVPSSLTTWLESQVISEYLTGDVSSGRGSVPLGKHQSLWGCLRVHPRAYLPPWSSSLLILRVVDWNYACEQCGGSTKEKTGAWEECMGFLSVGMVWPLRLRFLEWAIWVQSLALPLVSCVLRANNLASFESVFSLL